MSNELKDRPEEQENISWDHFFQLVLMDKRSRRAWLKHKAGEVPEEQQQKIADSRKELMERFAKGTTAKK